VSKPRRQAPTRDGFATVPLKPEFEPIAITPADESVAQPVASQVPAQTHTAQQPSAQEVAGGNVAHFPVQQPVPPAAPTHAPAVTQSASAAPVRKNVTAYIREDLKKEAETAVLWTGRYEDGHRTWAAIVEAGVERELQRLRDKYNEGRPFPLNEGTFRTGRSSNS